MSLREIRVPKPPSHIEEALRREAKKNHRTKAAEALYIIERYLLEKGIIKN